MLTLKQLRDDKEAAVRRLAKKRVCFQKQSVQG